MKDKKVQLFATIVFIMNLLLAIVSLFDTSIFKHVFLIVSYLAIMFAFLIYIVAKYIQSRNNGR
ncbi:hypothetical protein E3V59_06560 [Streptococcus pseudopneumoniae]|nr:hypothetical protein E3V59_06560 [Streptococcus pseudopneumoniae]VIW51417.1 Uncharacterised protein [Streptococcus pneumoniae]